MLGQVMMMSDFYKSGIRSFSDELQALIDYGHDCCARIDDKIHEHCQCIREAHEREIGAFELALGWKEDQLDSVHANLERELSLAKADAKTQRNNFDQATSAREHWKSLYEQSLEQIHDLEHDVEMWRDRAEDMRIERDDALKEHHAWAPESHYVMLPKDADGEPIHIGDRMDWVRYKDDDPTIVRTVSGIGNGVFFAWSDEQGRYAQYEAYAYRHHHADSWERIIEDARTCTGSAGNYTAVPSMRWTNEVDALVARCKALAGDAE